MLTFVPILFNTSSPNTQAGSIEIAQSLFKKMIFFCVFNILLGDGSTLFEGNAS